MQRTIKNAEAMLEAETMALNPEAYRRWRAEVDEAISDANAKAAEMVASVNDRFVARRDDALAEACQLRDDYDALVADGELGVLSAAEFEKRFNDLEARKRDLVRRENELAGNVAHVDRIEADPVAWVDETFYAKFPDRAPEFSF